MNQQQLFHFIVVHLKCQFIMYFFFKFFFEGIVSYVEHLN